MESKRGKHTFPAANSFAVEHSAFEELPDCCEEAHDAWGAYKMLIKSLKDVCERKATLRGDGGTTKKGLQETEFEF
jgi:hypothetical protein